MMYQECKSSEIWPEQLAPAATCLGALQATGPTFSHETTDCKHSLKSLKAGILWESGDEGQKEQHSSVAAERLARDKGTPKRRVLS